MKNNEHNFKITRAESQESLTAVIDAATADMSPERSVWTQPARALGTRKDLHAKHLD